MEQNLHSPEVYDFRRYDRVWQRVAPGLDPYAAVPAQTKSLEPAVPAMTAANMTQQTMRQTTQQAASQMTDFQQAASVRQESQLPGAELDPCCMGSAAAEMLDVLTGFIEEELEDQRQFRCLARQAPNWARQRLRDMAAEEGAHAKRLMAVYYLITGDCYTPAVSNGRICVGQWCAALRERYHAAACNGLNYARAAEGTTDPCLRRLLEDLSAGEYRHADELMRMLERSLRG